VNKVIKGYQKFSATPKYMVYNWVSDFACWIEKFDGWSWNVCYTSPAEDSNREGLPWCSVNKVIKGYQKLSATPKYIVYNWAGDSACWIEVWWLYIFPSDATLLFCWHQIRIIITSFTWVSMAVDLFVLYGFFNFCNGSQCYVQVSCPNCRCPVSWFVYLDLVCLEEYLWLFFIKKYIKIIFFIFKKLFLILVNNLKILKNINFK
jgi:hypothetical protein